MSYIEIKMWQKACQIIILQTEWQVFERFSISMSRLLLDSDLNVPDSHDWELWGCSRRIPWGVSHQPPPEPLIFACTHFAKPLWFPEYIIEWLVLREANNLSLIYCLSSKSIYVTYKSNMVLCFKTWKATKYKTDLTTYFLSVWALSVFSLTCVRVRWCFVYWNAFWLKSQLDVCSEGWSHESLGYSFPRVENDTLWKDLNNGGLCVCMEISHKKVIWLTDVLSEMHKWVQAYTAIF